MLFQLGATDFSKEADKKLGEGETTERNNSLADKFTQMAANQITIVKKKKNRHQARKFALPNKPALQKDSTRHFYKIINLYIGTKTRLKCTTDLLKLSNNTSY